MDRFIERNKLQMKVIQGVLKSSMDRFIAQGVGCNTKKSKSFKIQYG